MCLSKILMALKKIPMEVGTITNQPVDVTVTNTSAPRGDILIFPHPEENKDLTQTVNSHLELVRFQWFEGYRVPIQYRDYWLNAIGISFSSALPNPAWTVGAHIYCQVGYANAGILAYEAAHVAWSLLTNDQKTGFESTFNRLVKTDPMMIKLFAQYPHELVADIDTTGDPRIGGHAETYRILGELMPVELKAYYPRLF